MNPIDVVRTSVDTFNAADRQGFLDCYAEDCEITTPLLAGTGHDGVAAFWASTMGPMPDCRVDVHHLVGDGGELVGEEATARGTNTAASVGPDGTAFPPTGRSATFGLSAMHAVRDGRIVRSHFYWDSLAVMGQLGLLPDPTAA